jgi:outer membrane immunogenic protein
MRNLAVATALLAFATSSIAQAADLPTKAPILKAAPPAAYSWTGCYIGAAGGAGFGRSQHLNIVGQNITDPFNVSGGIAGVEYGCNWQTGSWVLGTESDFSWTSIRGNANDVPPNNVLVVAGANEKWLSTTRLRVGFLPNDQLLLYATGGIATARIEATIDRTALGQGFISESATRWGWTAGAGVEYALGAGWSVKADYLYARLASHGYFNPVPAPFVPRGNIPFDEHVVRLGVNYKFTNCFFVLFGCGGPVIARY